MPDPLVNYTISSAAALTTAAALIEPYRIQITTVTIVSDRLPAAFDGFTVLHLSDLHTCKYGLLERKIERLISQFQPDIIAATGDLAGSVGGVEHFCKLACAAPAPEGRFAVFGNGEHVVPEMGRREQNVLPEHDIRLLMNENVRIERGGESIIIAGVDDPFLKHADLPMALNSVHPQNFVVLLAHAPNIAAQAVELGVDLVLSGHTHGGQFKLPLLPAPYPHTGRGPRLEQGLYAGDRLSRRIGMDAGHTQVYVSRGLGASYVPARLFCRPELPIITLRQG